MLHDTAYFLGVLQHVLINIDKGTVLRDYFKKTDVNNTN